MPFSLAELLQEPDESVTRRERDTLESLLRSKDNRVVLFGAGNLGKRALTLLRELQCNILASSDNDEGRWDGSIDGIPILPPAQAASLYGTSALFLVTIWNDHHWFSETYAMLTHQGCTLVSTYAPIFWRYPDRFLQLYLLNDLPHKVYKDSSAVLQAEQIWADEASLHTYRANISWRALGDARDLPGRPEASTYFPADLLELGESDCVLDCGAFDGDTIRELVAHTRVNAIHAVEADAISLQRLRDYVALIEGDTGDRIRIYPVAVSSKRGHVHFESSGTLTSRSAESGPMVEALPIDDLFAETPLTFIKMDIEGAEYDALLGAERVIRRDRPILAICVYHTQSDIWRIPLLVHSMLPDHKLYLRGYEGDGFQTVLYAIPPDRALL